MSFLRHVGKHGDRKVAVIFREVPGEAHMCLVTYTELLNQHIHDPMMKCIESDIGQNSKNLADALNRSFTKDGRPILQVLHAEGQLKKVQTGQIIMTPAPNTKIKLDELNRILDEMDQGEAAVKRMAELDKSMGLQDPKDVARRMRGPDTSATSAANGALGDTQIADNLRQQAAKMSAEAKGLLAEAERLNAEAASMDGTPVKSTRGRKPKATAVVDVPIVKTRKARVKASA